MTPTRWRGTSRASPSSRSCISSCCSAVVFVAVDALDHHDPDPPGAGATTGPRLSTTCRRPSRRSPVTSTPPPRPGRRPPCRRRSRPADHGHQPQLHGVARRRHAHDQHLPRIPPPMSSASPVPVTGCRSPGAAPHPGPDLERRLVEPVHLDDGRGVDGQQRGDDQYLLLHDRRLEPCPGHPQGGRPEGHPDDAFRPEHRDEQRGVRMPERRSRQVGASGSC